MFEICQENTLTRTVNMLPVRISDMLVSDDPCDVLITYSLGSCLGVSVFDPVSGIGGLIHCMLPLSMADREKAHNNPAIYVDTGVTLLLSRILSHGGRKEDIIIKAAGCASMMNDSRFEIGRRNFSILRKVLWKNGIFLKSQAVGGTVSRTLMLEISTGKTYIKSQGREFEL